MDAGKVVQESKTEQSTNKGRRKPNSSMNLIRPSDSHIRTEESEKLSDHTKNQSKAGHDAPCEDPPSMEAAVPQKMKR